MNHKLLGTIIAPHVLLRNIWLTTVGSRMLHEVSLSFGFSRVFLCNTFALQFNQRNHSVSEKRYVEGRKGDQIRWMEGSRDTMHQADKGVHLERGENKIRSIKRQ